MELVECKNLCKKFDEKQILENINLTIPKGKIIGLLGKNGTGKTTLIKLINDLLTPTSGEVLINGNKPGVESKKIISYLPERTYLDKSMKVSQVITFFEEFYGNFNAYFDSKDDFESFEAAKKAYSELDDNERHVLKITIPLEKLKFAKLIFDFVENSEELEALRTHSSEKNTEANMMQQYLAVKRLLEQGIVPSRVDIRLENTATDSGRRLIFLNTSDDLAKIDMPQWMQKNGCGYSITAYRGKMKIKVLCKGNGKIRFELRGIDKKNDRKERIPVWIDYTRFSVDGKELLKNPTSAWHDRPHVVSVDVKDGTVIEIYYEWEPVNEIIKRMENIK